MSDDKSVTGPDDDEQYGHGGVEVPTEKEQTLPNVDDSPEDHTSAETEGDFPGGIAPS